MAEDTPKRKATTYKILTSADSFDWMLEDDEIKTGSGAARARSIWLSRYDNGGALETEAPPAHIVAVALSNWDPQPVTKFTQIRIKVG